jgi:hypothetical protein
MVEVSSPRIMYPPPPRWLRRHTRPSTSPLRDLTCHHHRAWDHRATLQNSVADPYQQRACSVTHRTIRSSYTTTGRASRQQANEVPNLHDYNNILFILYHVYVLIIILSYCGGCGVGCHQYCCCCGVQPLTQAPHDLLLT